jgi:DNA invertase Pin-like site-specific DNA recombinase
MKVYIRVTLYLIRFQLYLRSMKAKYIRVSTTEQNIDRQLVNSREYDYIYKDRVSGSVSFFDRQAGAQVKKAVVAGDLTELHVVSIDRLGRDIGDILHVVDFLSRYGVNLLVENLGMYSLTAGQPNPTFKLIVSVLGNVAEMERQSLLERQRQGIAIAKAKGIYRGRANGTVMTDEELLAKHRVVVRELRNGESLRRAARLGGVSLGTAQKVKKALL